MTTLTLWPEQTRKRTTALAKAYARTATYRAAKRRRLTQFWTSAVAAALVVVGAVLAFGAITAAWQ